MSLDDLERESLCALLSRAASRCDGRVVVVDGHDRGSYRMLLKEVAGLAAVFHALGVRDGDRVAMLSLNSAHYLRFYFASLWAGGVMVPLNHRLAEGELAALLDDAAPRILLCDGSNRDRAEALIAARPECQLIDLSRPPQPAAEQAALPDCADPRALAAGAQLPDLSSEGDALALIVYTGGTTGRPRGVMLSHRNVLANCAHTIPYLKLSAETTQLHLGPLFHMGAGQRIFSVTAAGGRHVLLPKFSPDSILETVAQERISAMVLVPTMIRRLLARPGFNPAALPSLRHLSYGAAPTPLTLISALMDRFPQVELMQSYGQSECAPVATALHAEDHRAGAPQLKSVGRPVGEVAIKIVDPQGEPCAVGEVGEVLIQGPNVMLGYWKSPEMSAETLRDGWLHSGDLGAVDEAGYLYLADRLKDMIISGGENVYSVEVEAQLLTHPAVLSCAVVGTPDPDLGEQVHAVLQCSAGAQVELASIQAHCRAALAGYKIPRSISLVDALPLTGANKVDKKALRATLSQAQRSTEQVRERR
ncbi:MAG: AMP-binding protein [Myxococcota bacterium]|nr:AMP-binding protein [Myxococcota bacterium]